MLKGAIIRVGNGGNGGKGEQAGYELKCLAWKFLVVDSFFLTQLESKPRI